MKRVLLAIALLAGFASSASAAFTTWQGDLFITSFTETAAGKCAAVNMGVGDFARFVLRPKSVAGNGTSDLLTWHFSRSSGQLAPVGGSLDVGTLTTLRTIGGSGGFTQLTNSPFAATVTPAAPTAATASVAVDVTINNIYSSSPSALSGCNPTFKGTLGKKP